MVWQKWNRREQHDWQKRFLVFCQILLVWLLGRGAYASFMDGDYTEPPKDIWIVYCRLFCAVVLHITLSDELRQSFELMKYALNHPWKFWSWSSAFFVGFHQMIVVISIELVNMFFMMSNNTVTDIVMNFLALVIISDFDDYFFSTVNHTPMGRMV